MASGALAGLLFGMIFLPRNKHLRRFSTVYGASFGLGMSFRQIEGLSSSFFDQTDRTEADFNREIDSLE